jgi:hypothetical protein
MTTAVRLRPLSVLGEALRVYRRHLRLLLLAALALYGPFSVIDALVEHHHQPVVLEIAGGALEIALHLLADIFYTGIVAAAAIGWRRGEQRTPRDIARHLPWRTLLVLDVGLALGTAVLLLALIVPGIVFYTWFALSPAVAEMDHVGARAALRTSRRLVRGSFFRVLTVLAIVQVGSFAVEQVLQASLGDFVVHALVNLGVQLVSGPLFGLATVLMVFELRRGRAGARGAGPSPAGPTISSSR